MNFQNRTLRWASLPERIRGMFNLNDPRWGRGEDKSEEGGVLTIGRVRPRTGLGEATSALAMASSLRIWMNSGAT